MIEKSSLRDPRETTPHIQQHHAVAPHRRDPLGLAEALKVETAEYTNGVGREFIAVAVYLKRRLVMNLKIAAMLIVSVFMSANTSYAGDLLDRML